MVSTDVRSAFLETARVAATLLRQPAVADKWYAESALAEFSVRGLAGHLAYQVLGVPPLLTEPVPGEPVVSLLDHYASIPWVGAPLDAEVNVSIRSRGEELAADAPAGLAATVEAALAMLTSDLPAVPNRPVRFPFWGPWSLTLDDLLITRTMELAVHVDDLAVSVDIDTPELPHTAADLVVTLLARVAVGRHGATLVIRALSRAERAPASIAAF
jgi:hypothetical protein